MLSSIFGNVGMVLRGSNGEGALSEGPLAIGVRAYHKRVVNLYNSP